MFHLFHVELCLHTGTSALLPQIRPEVPITHPKSAGYEAPTHSRHVLESCLVCMVGTLGGMNIPLTWQDLMKLAANGKVDIGENTVTVRHPGAA
jgi:hypothetical protein